MTVGQRIKQVREANRMSHYYLSMEADVGVTSIYQWERGEVIPSLPAFNRVLKALDVSYEEFMKGVDL